jgi:hypothetical protein
MPTTHLLYLHGFRSSPQSVKAKKMADLVAARHPSVTWWCPQLPPSPQQAMALLDQGLADWPPESMAAMVTLGLAIGMLMSIAKAKRLMQT